jgi:hypothetical protein
MTCAWRTPDAHLNGRVGVERERERAPEVPVRAAALDVACERPDALGERLVTRTANCARPVSEQETG